MIGQTLGHCRIEEQLGAGGMGVVYRATDSKLSRQVAIKVLPDSFAPAGLQVQLPYARALHVSHCNTSTGRQEATGLAAWLAGSVRRPARGRMPPKEGPSMIGQTLGHYRIEEQLGAGGMGVVYRATDSKLGRQVAIKVLPESFAKDPERLARFQREARMLAALNHPNIAAIHGLEESGGTHYLVLEYVPGNTLEGPLPLAEALRVASQIAEAFEAAHEKDIVHRDLKPPNVKVTPEGKVKVLDFGLAKAVSVQPTEATVSQAGEGTQLGAVMGTAGYMSPEQARGLPVDKRCDIWAFGCVLYETLTGRRAFGGRTLSDSIAAVLTGEPDWEALPVETPPHVRALLRRCLQKDLGRRQRDIGDARLELEETRPGDEAIARGGESRPRWRTLTLAAASLLLGALASGIAGWTVWHKPPEAPAVARFTIMLGPGEQLPYPFHPSAVLSRDGTRLAYSVQREGKTQLHVRALDQFESKAIPGSEGINGWPVFSPDGQWVAFRQGVKWMKAALTGGPLVKMFDAPQGGAYVASWGPDNRLVLGVYPASIARIAAAGGTLQEVPGVDPKKGERWGGAARYFPDGKAMMFGVRTSETESFDDYQIAAYSFETGKRNILIDGGQRGMYWSGYLIYVRGGTLFAVPFDRAKLTATGSPVPVVDGIFTNAVLPVMAAVDISDNGTLVYVPGGLVGSSRKAVWVDRQGKAQPLPLPPRAYLHPRLSPDGQQVAIEVEGPNHDVFTYDLERGTLTKVTFDGSSHAPFWTPDGKRLTYRSGMPAPFTMWAMPADRSSGPERLTTIGEQQSAASWSADGQAVAFTQVNPETKGDIYVLRMDSERKPRPFAQSKFDEGAPRFSPDGHWIAYSSNESGRTEVYVQAYPGPGAKILISTEGGSDPTWRRQGGELYYRNGNKMMAVAVSAGGAFRAGAPKLLWEGRYNQGLNSMCGPPGPGASNYDVTGDGQRFLMIQEGEQDVAPNRIHVVLNWAEELKRLMAENRKP